MKEFETGQDNVVESEVQEEVKETVEAAEETAEEAAETAQDTVEDVIDQKSTPVVEVEEIKTGSSKKKQDKEGKKMINPVLEWVLIIAAALAAALFINYVIIINSVVPSGSMESTIMTNSRMMGLRVTYWFSDPQQGDIIVFKYPDDPKQNFVKRVIGTPGDTVEIIHGVTFVNGEALDEPYLNETPRDKNFGPYEVPEDCYFVMGDNRNNSHDSRYWNNTYVTRDAVLGKALFCYWPVNRIGILK